MKFIYRLLAGIAGLFNKGETTMADEDQAQEQPQVEQTEEQPTQTEAPEENAKSEVEKALEKVEAVLKALGKDISDEVKDAFEFVKKHG